MLTMCFESKTKNSAKKPRAVRKTTNIQPPTPALNMVMDSFSLSLLSFLGESPSLPSLWDLLPLSPWAGTRPRVRPQAASSCRPVARSWGGERSKWLLQQEMRPAGESQIVQQSRLPYE